MAKVPSLEGSLYLTDPQSIIAFIIRKYFRTPKEAVGILENMIISLRHQVSLHGGNPEALTGNITTDLQGVFNRIFAGERAVNVVCSYDMTDGNQYSVTININYVALSGEVSQVPARVYLKDGQLVIPEDNLANYLT